MDVLVQVLGSDGIVWFGVRPIFTSYVFASCDYSICGDRSRYSMTGCQNEYIPPSLPFSQ